MSQNLPLNFRRCVQTGVFAWIMLACLYEVASAQDQEYTAKIVADQVRSQDIACVEPSSAERDEAESAPHEPVYVLKCQNAVYKVRLVPDQAAIVSEIK